MGDDLLCREDGRIEGRVGVGDEHDLVALSRRGAAGRVDAVLRLQPRHDQALYALGAKPGAQIRLLEGIAMALLDDGLAALRRGTGMDLPALRAMGQHIAGAAV